MGALEHFGNLIEDTEREKVYICLMTGERTLGIEQTMDQYEKMRLVKKTVKIRQPGLSHSQLMEAYREWQQSGLTYDEVVLERGYTAPIKTAQTLARYVSPDARKGYAILDVGAGTGLVAQELVKVDFDTVDALEPSEDLLEDAEKKEVYRNIYKCFMTGEKTPNLEDGQYDGLVTCGCLVENHLPRDVFDEMIRVVKPGGYLVITTRLVYLTSVNEYKDRLEPYMNTLEEQGKWKLELREIFPNYYGDDEGIVWVYSKA